MASTTRRMTEPFVTSPTCPACVSTTCARAAVSWSASQEAGSKARRSASQASMEASTSGGSVMASTSCMGSIRVASSMASQPPSTSARPATDPGCRRAISTATMAPSPWPATTAGGPATVSPQPCRP